MPMATPPLSEDEIDDLLYFARTGDTLNLKNDIDIFTKSLATTTSKIVAATVDYESRNGLLHYAAANGHLDTVQELLTMSSPTNAPTINLQNTAGNTPLHWAALNGHLSVVKALVAAGADVTIVNKSGHDAVFEAESNKKDEVAEWLLKEGVGLESTVGRSRETQGTTEGGEQLEEVIQEGELEEGG